MKELITNINELDINKKYSYADYVLWKFKERVEILRGRIFKMTPAPNVSHQRIAVNLLGVLYPHFQNRSCQLFSAPFDVALLNHKKSTPENQIHTIVQPDLCVVCDEEKLADGKKCMGAPDLIIEILSPGNSEKEMNLKFDLYEEAGVKEYWMVYPEEKSVIVYVLENGKYIGLKPYTETQVLTSRLFSDVQVELRKIF